MHILNNFEDGKGLIRFDENGIVVIGEVDSLKSGIFLSNFFKELNEMLSDEAEVKFDITALKYINSTGIKALVEWITKLKNNKPGVKVNFIYDQNVTWQNPCLKPLTVLSPNSVSLTPKDN